MTPLIHLEPEVMLSRMQREVFAKAVAQATRDQGSDWVASAVPKSSQQPGAPASSHSGCRSFQTKENIMNSLIMCTAVTLNIFSAPAGNQVVGTVPADKEGMDGSLLRDWVFVGKPGPDGVSPRGWVIYAGLGQC